MVQAPPPGDPTPIRVAVVDDHDLLRRGLRELLEEHGFDVVGEAGDGDAAIELVARTTPDVVLMDISMPGRTGLEATRSIRASTPNARVVILTVSPDEGDVDDAILAGACGYLLKDADPDAIVAAIRAAAAGESLLSPRIAASLLERWRTGGTISSTGGAALTERELEVLGLMAEGKDNPEIAAELFISLQTVKNHVSNVLAKLEVDNRIQAAVHAVRQRLV
jgi:DNA-binding NarL/FixJ family response regulator